MAEHGARALGSTGGIVYALEGGDTLRVVGSWGHSPETLGAFGVLPLADDLPAPEAARDRRIVTGDVATGVYPSLQGAGAFCAVPIVAGPELLGALAVNRASGPFLPAERELLEALGQVAAHALERASLHGRLSRLQATTADLARALTPHEVAVTAAEQGAEALGASSAWVALVDREHRTLELAHAAGHAEGTVQRFRSFSLDAELPLAEAVRTTAPLWLEGPDAIFGRFPRFAEVRPGAQAAALLPLVDGEQALGAIGLVFDAPRVFGTADRDYLLTLTALCGQALGRARVYQAERDLALTLQQALLPDGLPRAEGLELAVRYLPRARRPEAGDEERDDPPRPRDAAGAGARVSRHAAAGGDFYDAIALPGGRLGIAVGDVVGHGPQAAATMGQLRGALRAYVLEGRAPARVLQLLSRYADGVPGARGATVAYAVLDPAAREVRYASAGHPPPLLLTPGEDPRFLNGARGVPLNRALGQVYTDAAAPLAENGTLILYSDGVVERRGEPLEAGMARLAAAADGALSPEALADRLLETVDPRRGDDVALLVARVHVPDVTPLRMWFAARPDQLAVVREAMRGWLASAGVDRGDGEMLVLAAGELCANAVEHAYPAENDGSVEVALSRDTAGTLSLVVRDRGRWRPRAVDPGDRGRGLAIVRGLMSEVEIDGAAQGTTVTVRYRPAGLDAPPPPPAGPALVAIERRDEITVARLTGEVDELNVRAVETALAELGAEPVVVDLSRVAFIGSAGVRLLFALAERVPRLVLVAPRDAPFRRALEVAELGRVAELVETWE